MYETKKENNQHNSSNDLTIINSNILINKDINNDKENKNKRAIHKIKTSFKKDEASGDFKINEIILGKSKPEFKFKRVWSTQNIVYNINRTSKYKSNLFNNYINIYSGASIYSAPSVKENRIEINKLIKSGKNKRMNYLNHIHNNIMIKSSKLYRKKLNYFSKDNSFDNKTKNDLKKKYNMKDMSEINKIKLNLTPCFRGVFVKKKNRRNFSSNNLTLKRYNNNIINKKIKYLHENTLSTKMTNYLSKYLSGKKAINTIYETKNNKTKEINYITNSNKITSGIININKKANKKHFEFIKKKPLLKNYSKNILKENNMSEIKNQNSDRLYKDIEASKMLFELNDIVFNKKKKIYKLNEIEIKLIKFQTLKEFQEGRLELMSNQDVNGLKKRIILLNDNIKKFNQISLEYFININNYIHFLKDKIYNLRNYFDEENNKRFNLYFDLEKLVIDNILKQKELEYLIEIKHFLVQVKNTLIKQPSYFNIILKETSRKYELAKLIRGLKISPQNQIVIKFLETLPDTKDAEMASSFLSQLQPKTIINKSLKKQKSKKYSQITLLRNKFNENSITKYLLFPEKQIFETPDEFIIIFDNIENKNLRLMKESYYLKKKIDKLKNEYDEIFQSNRIMEKCNDINKKEEKIKQLKKENETLKETFNYLLGRKNGGEENDKRNKNNEEIRTFFMDLNIFKKITYYKMLNNYKYKGLLLLNRLIDIIKNFFTLNYTNYGIDKAYIFVEKNSLNKILNINKKNINSLNRLAINKYILCLLKIYENICQFIKYRDIEYNSIEENKLIIHKKKEEIQLQRKINNTRIIRQLAEEKRTNGIEKIVKKNNKPNLLFKGNIDDNIVLKNKIKSDKIIKERGKIKQNFLEKEFNFYVSYNDNN